MTPVEKRAFHMKWLKFAISLSQMDLGKLKEGQRLDLENEFREFLQSGPKTLSDYYLREREPTEEDTVSHKAFIVQRSRDKGYSSSQADEIAKWIMAAERSVRPAKRTGEPDLQLAANCLMRDLETLTDRPDLNVTVHAEIIAAVQFRRSFDSFEYGMYADDPAEKIRVLLWHHLKESGISPSMLRRCPKCEAFFLASRKPPAGKTLYCPAGCSHRAAENRYHQRKRLLPKIKRLHVEQGRTEAAIAKLTGLNSELDRKWLRGRLGEMTRSSGKKKR